MVVFDPTKPVQTREEHLHHLRARSLGLLAAGNLPDSIISFLAGLAERRDTRLGPDSVIRTIAKMVIVIGKTEHARDFIEKYK